MGGRETIEVSSSKFYLGGMDGTSEVQILVLTGELLEYDNDTKKKKKKWDCYTSAKERKMDEFLSITDPLTVSNCLDRVSLWISLINLSLISSSVVPFFFSLPNSLGIS